jgi:hypothetical protein
VRFQVLTAASIKIRAFWVVAPCSLVGLDRRFRGAYCLHNQGDDIHRSTPTRLNGATSQKTIIFIGLSDNVWTMRHTGNGQSSSYF